MKRPTQLRSALAVAVLLSCSHVTPQASAVPENIQEGTLVGYPQLVDPQNQQRIAVGQFKQWIEGGDIHIQIRYEFKDGRTTTEKDVLTRSPNLVQKSFSWEEKRNDLVVRQFSADLVSGKASALKIEKAGEKPKTWEEKLSVVPGRTFAGVGMTYAVKNEMAKLEQGEKIELKAAVFTPKPRTTDVEVYSVGEERIAASNQKVRSQHLIVHPKIPGIVKLFVKAPDIEFWITEAKPYAILRFQGPLQEPSDALVRLDIYPPTRAG